MAGENTENTGGNFSGGEGEHLAGVNMNRMSERLTALTGIMSGLDEDGNDLPAGETRTQDEPAEPKPAPKPKAKPKAKAREDVSDDLEPDGEGDGDTGEDDDSRDIQASDDDAGKASGADDQTGDEDLTFSSFEEVVEAAGLDDERLSGLTFEIAVDGEKQTIPYKELVTGYRRQRDLTRGFQELSEAKGVEVQAHQKIAEAYRHNVAQHVASLKALDSQILFDENQIERFRASNPEAAAAAMARNQRNRAAFDQGLKEVQAIDNQRLEAEAQEAAAKAQYGHDMLMSRHPSLNRPEKLETFKTEFTEYLTGAGFTADDIDGINDYRFIEVVMDAMGAGKAKKLEASVASKTVKNPTKRTLKKRSSTAKRSGAGERAEVERANAIRAGKKGSLASFLVDKRMV